MTPRRSITTTIVTLADTTEELNALLAKLPEHYDFDEIRALPIEKLRALRNTIDTTNEDDPYLNVFFGELTKQEMKEIVDVAIYMNTHSQSAGQTAK